MNRRDFLAAGSAAGLGLTGLSRVVREARAAAPSQSLATASAAQRRWQRDELGLFLHFGVNTFTGREWGDGREDPRLFAPARLDARQWARAARAGGFRIAVLTAKHHDGFCLWPTATTEHSVRRSPWRDGTGDVVREFVDAMRAEGLRVGLYLSPWDRHEPSYGDTPRYNDFYERQLTELLTRYGEIAEVWFDGANGEGPNGRRQVYDWPRVWGTVRRLQPGAVIFSDAGPDVRWAGNERGVAGDPNWCAVDPAAVPAPGVEGPAVGRMLQHGDPRGTVWRPAECDVSIRPGWFWRASEDDRVRTRDDLARLYFESVGRNANLLLNVPPTTDGLLHPTDVSRLEAFGAWRAALLATNLARGARSTITADARAARTELRLRRPATFDVVSVREELSRGQAVARHRVEAWVGGGWREVAAGTTIGNRRLHRVPPTRSDRVRVTVDEAIAPPRLAEVTLHRDPRA